METIEIQVYDFDELNEDIKQKVIDEWRINDNYFWHDENKGVLGEFEKLFPVDIKNWEYGYRNYIDFELETIDYDYQEEIENLTGIRLLKYIYNNYYNDLYVPKYLHSKCIGSENNITGYAKLLKQENTLCGYCIGYDILRPIFDFLKKPSNDITLYDLMNECLNEWIRVCNNDYEYWYSDENIIEEIQANEYMFLANGELH